MAANKGWICLHRSIQDSWLWENGKNECFSNGQAFIDMLLLANHEDRKIRINSDIVTIKRGQFYTSIVKLATRWNWSRNRVKRFLKMLEKDDMIEAAYESGCGTALTIVNYSKFQDMRTGYEAPCGTGCESAHETKVEQDAEQHSNHKQQYNNYINNDNNMAAPPTHSFTPYVYKESGKPKQTQFHKDMQTNKYDFAALEQYLLERDRPKGDEL